MLSAKTLNPLGRFSLGNCYVFLLVNSPAINSQNKLRISHKEIATQHKIEPLANPMSPKQAKQWGTVPSQFACSLLKI